MGIIQNGKNININERTGTVPDVSGSLMDWWQPMIFSVVTKDVESFQASETKVDVKFRGVIQPLKNRDLLIKKEGERAWTWYNLHSDISLQLDVDDVVTYLGKQTRIMARKDYKIYGYMYYELVQDWTGAGPADATP